MLVRCKFICTRKSQTQSGFDLELQPVTGGSEENKEFFKYTPSGHLQFGTINDAAAQQFEPGQAYYIDIFPAKPAQPE